MSATRRVFECLLRENDSCVAWSIITNIWLLIHLYVGVHVGVHGLRMVSSMAVSSRREVAFIQNFRYGSSEFESQSFEHTLTGVSTRAVRSNIRF